MNTITQRPSLKKKIGSLSEKIGNTALHHFSSLSNNQVKIYGKLEWQQLGGSVKSRPAYNIIRTAIMRGRLKPDQVLLDASSGNTAIAYAHIAREIGISVTICLPENASRKRKEILTDLGVNLILTSPLEGTDGSQQEAKRLYARHPDLYFYADQYGNPANWQAHYHGTAEEIFRETRGKISHFIAGLGTTGTFTGTGLKFKRLNPDIQLIALQPDSPMHGLEGWKHLETAIVPPIFHPALEDGRMEIDSWEAYEMIKRIHRDEGLWISPSSAANLVGARNLASTLDQGTIVTILPDSIEKYDEVKAELFG